MISSLIAKILNPTSVISEIGRFYQRLISEGANDPRVNTHISCFPYLYLCPPCSIPQHLCRSLHIRACSTVSLDNWTFTSFFYRSTAHKIPNIKVLETLDVSCFSFESKKISSRHSWPTQAPIKFPSHELHNRTPARLEILTSLTIFPYTTSHPKYIIDAPEL